VFKCIELSGVLCSYAGSNLFVCSLASQVSRKGDKGKRVKGDKEERVRHTVSTHVEEEPTESELE